jgi:hypothetical protein
MRRVVISSSPRKPNKVITISYEDWIRFKLHPYFRRATPMETSGEIKCELLFLPERNETFVFNNHKTREYFKLNKIKKECTK